MDEISRGMVKISTMLSRKDRLIQPIWLQEANSYGCSSALQRSFRPLCTALSIGPARPPPREPHYSALSFDFDALALGMHSGQMPAPMHRPNLQAPVQSVGTCSICRCRLNLQARAQSAATGSICRHGLNLQARFERRMSLRIPYGHPGPQDVSHGLAVLLYEMTGPALHPAWGIGTRRRPWIPHGIHHVSPYAI